MCPRIVEHFITYVRFQRGECGSAIIINTHNRSAASSESQTRKCSRVTPPPPLLSGIHTCTQYFYTVRAYLTQSVFAQMSAKELGRRANCPHSMRCTLVLTQPAAASFIYIRAHVYCTHILKALAYDTTCAFFLVRAARTTIRTARCRCVRKLFSASHVCWLH